MASHDDPGARAGRARCAAHVLPGHRAELPGAGGRHGPVSSAFAAPAAYRDLVAGILAVVAVVLLAKRANGATAAVWLFNVWGACNLLFAMFQGPHVRVDPGALGAAFFIPTAVVPPMLLSHFLVFRLLLAGARPASSATAHQT